MNREGYGRESADGGTSVVNTVTGIALLVVGAGAAVWILAIVGQAIGGSEQLPVVGKIVGAFGEGGGLETAFGVADSRAVGVTLGYLVAFLLLSIAAGIAKTLIASGAKIMNPDYKKVLTELKNEFGRERAPQ